MKKNITKSVLTLAGAAMVCSTSLQGAAIVYDGFEVGDGTLGGNAGGTGLSGNWGAESLTTAGSLSYGALQTSGGRVTKHLTDQFQQNGISPGSTLSNAGLMGDGATVWFSLLLVNHNPVSGDNRTYFAFGEGNADGFDRVGGTNGGGFTAALSKVSRGGVTAQAWNDGQQSSPNNVGATRGATVAVTDDATFLAVGSITWGAFGVTDDVFNLYLPGTDLVQGAVMSTISADFDQLGTTDANHLFDTISITGGRPDSGVPEFDELRFGASYADVTPVPEPSSSALLGLGGLALIFRRRK